MSLSEAPLTNAEVEIVKRFLSRAETLIDSDQGITSYCPDDGVQVTEWGTEYEYGETYLRSYSHYIPWIAFTDPPEYDRQCAEEKAARQRENERLRQAALAKREEEERKTLAALKAKYEGEKAR